MLAYPAFDFDAERYDRFNPEAKQPRKAYVTGLLEGRQGPVAAAADYWIFA